MKMPTLANAELSIMEVLWQHGDSTARQIQERLYPGESKSQHGTVQRLLQRLEDKDFVARDRALGVNVFSPRVTRESYVSRQLESLTKRLTGGSLAPVITHLLEQEKLSDEEIARLRRVLDQDDGSNDRGEPS